MDTNTFRLGNREVTLVAGHIWPDTAMGMICRYDDLSGVSLDAVSCAAAFRVLDISQAIQKRFSLPARQFEEAGLLCNKRREVCAIQHEPLIILTPRVARYDDGTSHQAKEEMEEILEACRLKNARTLRLCHFAMMTGDDAFDHVPGLRDAIREWPHAAPEHIYLDVPEQYTERFTEVMQENYSWAKSGQGIFSYGYVRDRQESDSTRQSRLVRSLRSKQERGRMKKKNNYLPQSIIDELLQSPDKDGDALQEALLWRGFLVSLDTHGELALIRGSDEDDVRMLQDLQFQVSMYDEGEYLASLQQGSKVPKRRILQNILNLAPRNHMAWALSRQGDNECSFFQCKYGSKHPTVHLDPGVALMVKVLPVCGLRTVLSCQGRHNEGRPKWPEVYFHSKYDMEWASTIFEELASRLPEFKRIQWVVDAGRGGGWLRWKIAFKPQNTDDESDAVYWDTIENIQMAARQFLRPEVYEPIRAAKWSVSEFGQLHDALRETLDSALPIGI